MDQITVHGYAKINLTLKILSKRDDGFHEIESIMQKADLCDDVTVRDRPDGRITITSDNPDIPQHPLNGSLNIAAKAAELLKSRYAPSRGADIFIRKRIPVAAGLGGGSSDAAACLIGLTRLWEIPIEMNELLQVGAEIGSDVPFALSSATALVTGRGEKVLPLASPPEFWMALVKPDRSLLAAEAYSEFDAGGGGRPGDPVRVMEGITSGDVERLASGMGNALQAPVERLAPEVLPIMDGLRRFDPCSVIVSGSGPTVVAVARDRDHAETMVEAFRGKPGIDYASIAHSLCQEGIDCACERGRAGREG